MVKDGGPAFPGKAPHFTMCLGITITMSKRDWFAGQAYARNRLASGQLGREAPHGVAYEQADAMLKARDAE